MVKLKDIAKECHTSAATVSKALHDSRELSKETTARIKKVAARMGYVPNVYAQALKMKRSYSIGVIFNDKTKDGGLKHEYFSSVLEAVKSEAESHGYAITFLSPDPSHKMTYLQIAKFRNTDGVVIVSEKFTDPEIVELVASSLPVVTIDYSFSSATSIMSDNVEGYIKLVNYVASLGYKKIAFIHGEKTDVTQKRLSGFYEGMKECGLTVNKDYILEAVYHDPKSTGRATKKLMALSDRPDVIFYPDDISLLGGLTALGQMGIKVPEDIGVVGYDGANISRVFRPQMTTYCQNSEALGREAAKYLIEQIEGPEAYIVSSHSVTGHIQEGGTTIKKN